MRHAGWIFAAGMAFGAAAVAGPLAASSRAIEHGRFLVNFGGCNDCHTPGWDQHQGTAPADELLTGSGLNFQGPWGTTYPANLRLYFQKLTVKEWIAAARHMRTRPAMPWWTFRYLTDQDLTDMYAYIHALGPAGKPAHAYVPSGQSAPAPYLKLTLPAKQVASHP